MDALNLTPAEHRGSESRPEKATCSYVTLASTVPASDRKAVSDSAWALDGGLASERENPPVVASRGKADW